MHEGLSVQQLQQLHRNGVGGAPGRRAAEIPVEDVRGDGGAEYGVRIARLLPSAQKA